MPATIQSSSVFETCGARGSSCADTTIAAASVAFRLAAVPPENLPFIAWTRQRSSAPLRLFGSFIEIKNQLTTRFEVTVRDTRTQNRRLDSNLPPEPTAGNLGYTVKPSIDYNVSQQLTARAYYELSVNKPALSTAFPTRFTAWGVQIRFTLN